MPFPEQFLDELIERTDITELIGRYVSLTKRGNRYFGRCPFHNEKSPSFCVTPERAMFYCFGCHQGGGVIQFAMKIENMTFPEACVFLAERVGMSVELYESKNETVDRKRLWEINAMAARWFYSNLISPVGLDVMEYLKSRRISPKTARRFGLGAAISDYNGLLNYLTEKGISREEMEEVRLLSKNDRGVMYDVFRSRLMFPIFDVRGNVIAFSGRAISASITPKYKNTAESPIYAKRKTIFGLSFAKNSPADYFILTEGNIDVVTLHQYGYTSAVATCGTALTGDQAKLLARYKKEVILAYDSDSAGKAATQKAIVILDAAGIKVRVLCMPEGSDPDSYMLKYGRDAFNLLIENSKYQMEYRIETLRDKYDLTQNDARIEFLREGTQLLLSLNSEASRHVYAAKLADAAGVPVQVVESDLIQNRKIQIKRQNKQTERELVYPKSTLDKAEEILLACLLQNNERLRHDITPELFSQPVMRQLYQHILEGKLLNNPELTQEETALLARLMSSDTIYNEQAFEECLAKVLEQSAVRTALSAGEDELLVKFNQMREKKRYGG